MGNPIGTYANLRNNKKNHAQTLTQTYAQIKQKPQNSQNQWNCMVLPRRPAHKYLRNDNETNGFECFGGRCDRMPGRRACEQNLRKYNDFRRRPLPPIGAPTGAPKGGAQIQACLRLTYATLTQKRPPEAAAGRYFDILMFVVKTNAKLTFFDFVVGLKITP